MSNSKRLLSLLAVLASVPVHAQAQGFALERFSPAPSGAGWWLNDELRLEGGLGGAVSLQLGYAHNPLRLRDDGGSSLAVVAHQAVGTIGGAVVWNRFRLSVEFAGPIDVSGSSGVVNGVDYMAPHVNLEDNPDGISDVRVGLDARLWGDVHGPFRVGLGAQLFIPSGSREQYVSDETWRGVGRVLFAGDVHWFSWAANLGVHVRPLDDGATPNTPRGSEALAGFALGARLPLAGNELLVGPELAAVTAFKAAFVNDTTGVEVLLGARWEQVVSSQLAWRLKLAGGVGVHAAFGVPEWRVLVGVELLGHTRALK
jgi:OmpA-OmpF porin, OOP family